MIYAWGGISIWKGDIISACDFSTCPHREECSGGFVFTGGFSDSVSHAGALESDLMLIRFKWLVFSLIVSYQWVSSQFLLMLDLGHRKIPLPLPSLTVDRLDQHPLWALADLDKKSLWSSSNGRHTCSYINTASAGHEWHLEMISVVFYISPCCLFFM